jgi:hypothetical protein
MHAVSVFDKHMGGWVILKTFSDEKQAKAFVANYPSFGAEWSRNIREGNWQIFPA